MTATHALKLTVVTAGLGEPSSTRMLADRLAQATSNHLRHEAKHISDVVVVELRELATAIAQKTVQGLSDPALDAALLDVLNTDGLIAVSPIYNASYSGLFKSFFDLVEAGGLRDTPALLAATGGTPRHSLVLEHAMRPLFSFLGADIVPTGVYAASQDWGGVDYAAADDLPSRIEKAGRQLSQRMGYVSAGPPREGQGNLGTDAPDTQELVGFERHLADLGISS